MSKQKKNEKPQDAKASEEVKDQKLTETQEKAQTPATKKDALKGDNRHRDVYLIDGEEVKLGAIIVAAQDECEHDVEAWNDLPEAKRHDLIEKKLNDLQAKAKEKAEKAAEKKAADKAKEDEKLEKKAENQVKDALFSKKFPQGFSSDTPSEQIALIEEAGRHLFAQKKWKIETTQHPDGSVTKSVVNA